MADDTDNQPAAADESSASSEPLTAAQRRAQAVVRGDASAAQAPASQTSGDAAAGAQPATTKRRRTKKEKKKYDSILGYLWGEWIRPLGTILIIVMSVRLTVVDWFDVPTGSMEPTILVGDRILVHKWVYGLRVPFTKQTWLLQWGTPERGEIVVCYSPDQGDEVRLVKRLVAQGGDTVELKDGRLIINGTPASYEPDEPSDAMLEYLQKNWGDDSINRSQSAEFFTEIVEADDLGPGDRHPVVFDERKPGLRNIASFEVPADHFVVIGDNRDNSKDSRQWNLSQSEWGSTFGVIHKDRIHGRAFAVAFSLNKKNAYLPRLSRTGKPLD
ncbi:MAG: signal peptidase I [Planctomycetota bacterium]